MNKIISAYKRLGLARILSVFLAGVFLLITTACGDSSSVNASQGSTNKAIPNQTELYETIQPREGGMNQYSDTDPRQNTSGMKAKAKATKDQAKTNLNRSENPEEFAESFKNGEPIGERVENLGEDIGSSVKEFSSNVSEGAKKNFENLQENIKSAPESLSEKAKVLKENM
ncbi:MAG: DUF6658 family protein [Spirulinaceae cyanobacterium]